MNAGIVWLVLGMALLRDRSISSVAEHLRLAIAEPDGTSIVAPSALSQARARLGEEPMEWLFHKAASLWGHASADRERWCSRAQSAPLPDRSPRDSPGARASGRSRTGPLDLTRRARCARRCTGPSAGRRQRASRWLGRAGPFIRASEGSSSARPEALVGGSGFADEFRPVTREQQVLHPSYARHRHHHEGSCTCRSGWKRWRSALVRARSRVRARSTQSGRHAAGSARDLRGARR